MKVLTECCHLEYEVYAGGRIDKVCEQVAWLANIAQTDVMVEFNGTRLKCSPGMTADQLQNEYHEKGPGHDEI